MNVDRFPVEAGHVLAFRRACGDLDAEASADTAGSVYAPPTFVQAGAQFEVGRRLRPGTGPWWGSARGHGRMPEGGGALHAEQRFIYHRPVRVGDVLTAVERPGKQWQKSGRSGVLRFTEAITEYRGAEGELVVTASAVAVYRAPVEEPAR